MSAGTPPKKNAIYTFYVGLVSQADTKLLQNNPTIAAGDFKVSTDGGTLGNLGTLPVVTPASSDAVKVTMSATEMNGDDVVIIASDAAGAEWTDQLIHIKTSTRQLDDLSFPTTSGRSTDVTAGGTVGLDWGNVENKGTANDLSGTDVQLVDTTTVNTDMRGTDSAALASVIGALADGAADGDPTSADTVMQYVKQLINVLMGSAGIVSFPAEQAPANTVSIAEVLRAIHADVTGLAGAAMRGTDSAALASVCTEARLAELDAGNIPTDLSNIQTDTDDIQLRLPFALTTGTADSGSTTTMVDAARTEADVDYWRGMWIRFTSGNITDQVRLVTAFAPGSDTITFTPATTQAVGTNAYELLPAGAVDLGMVGADGQSLIDLKDFVDAGYDPAVNKIEGCKLTDTVTTNTDVRGTDSAALASVCTETRLSELDAGTGGKAANQVDLIKTEADKIALVDAGAGVSGSVVEEVENRATPAQVNIEVLDVVDTDTITLPGQVAPPVAPTRTQMWAWIYKTFRNKKRQTSTIWELYDDAGSTIDSKATVSDAASIATKEEIVSGP